MCRGGGRPVLLFSCQEERVVRLVGMERREERSLLNSGDASDGVDD